MEPAEFVRRDLTDRLDAIAMLLEQVATEAIDEGELELATDLWVSSARVLSAAMELGRPVDDAHWPWPANSGLESADGELADEE